MRENKDLNRVFVIGCGGVGTLLTPVLCKLVKPGRVELVDGDEFEKKNLDRQLFHPISIGMNKARALADLYNCAARPEWFTVGLLDLQEDDWLIVCVDNHPARHSALQESDRTGCKAIIAANEVHSSEAYYYQHDWNKTKLDPRVYYPEIETVQDNNPAAIAIGCVGEVQENNRQLVTANQMAAALAMHLFTIWCLEQPKLKKETAAYLPFHLLCNLSRLEHRLVKDYQEKGQQ